MRLFPKMMITIALSLYMTHSGYADIVLVQSTTSTQNSGLYDYILPLYHKESSDEVRVVAVGTGQAIKNARNCDGDVLLVHSLQDERQFIADGYGDERHNLMHNDFILIGPRSDPAGVSAASGIEQALSLIAKNKNRFISRGDDSGTHKAELRFWALSDISPTHYSGSWYIETGQSMGGTLNMAVQLDGYAITDRSTWLAFGNRLSHDILFEGDTQMFNQYGIIVVNQTKCPNVHYEAATRFVSWLLSETGQRAINSYQVGGYQLFFANADKK